MTVSDNQKKEIIQKLIEKLYKPSGMTEEESVDIILEIERLSPDPEICDYIFEKKYDDLTIDEIIEKAFNYKPIILGDQSSKD